MEETSQVRTTLERPRAAINGAWVDSYELSLLWFRPITRGGRVSITKISLLPIRMVANHTRKRLLGLGQGLLYLQAAFTNNGFQFFAHKCY